MEEDKLRKFMNRLSGEEIDSLRRLQAHGTVDVRDLGGDQSALKSLEVHNLIFRKGSMVSLTYRGKMIARRI